LEDKKIDTALAKDTIQGEKANVNSISKSHIRKLAGMWNIVEL